MRVFTCVLIAVAMMATVAHASINWANGAFYLLESDAVTKLAGNSLIQLIYAGPDNSSTGVPEIGLGTTDAIPAPSLVPANPIFPGSSDDVVADFTASSPGGFMAGVSVPDAGLVDAGFYFTRVWNVDGEGGGVVSTVDTVPTAVRYIDSPVWQYNVPTGIPPLNWNLFAFTDVNGGDMATTDTPLVVTAVIPEPTVLGLVLAGLFGIRLLRRK